MDYTILPYAAIQPTFLFVIWVDLYIHNIRQLRTESSSSKHARSCHL
jgi:hypothetical protein